MISPRLFVQKAFSYWEIILGRAYISSEGLDNGRSFLLQNDLDLAIKTAEKQ